MRITDFVVVLGKDAKKVPGAPLIMPIFWCGLFGKGVADGVTGGIINPTTGVGSGVLTGGKVISYR